MKINEKTVLGIIFIAIGVNLLFEQLGIPGIAGVISELFWQIILIIGSLYLLAKRNYFFGGGLFVLSTAMLVSSIFKISLWTLIWPIIIIYIGVSILFKSFFSKEKIEKDTSSDLSINVAFSDTDKKIISKSFTGGKVNCAFGEVKVDLSETQIADDGAKLELNVVFGKIEVIIPKEMNVISDGSAFLGGWENKSKNSTLSGENKLRLVGTAIFGEVEIKN